jgi:hypothetical protein
MPPEDRFVPRFAAEPPQEGQPYGRWAERLKHEFLGATLGLDGDGEDLGEPGDLTFFPDRTWNGRTYVPITCRTSTGVELFGAVSYVPSFEEGEEPSGFATTADWTLETAEANPEWQLDLCDELGKVAAMTLVWGTALVDGGQVATAELADLVVDQCTLLDGRFTLLAPDDYRGDTLDIRLYDAKGRRLAGESLYADDGEDDDAEDDAAG